MDATEWPRIRRPSRVQLSAPIRANEMARRRASLGESFDELLVGTRDSVMVEPGADELRNGPKTNMSEPNKEAYNVNL